jgi:CHASE1-domain containing sensor protein
MNSAPPTSPLSVHDFRKPVSWLPGLILLLGWALTAVLTEQTRSLVKAETSAELTLTAYEVAARIEKRLQAHALVLRGTAAFFEASNVVTRQEFHLYVEQLLLEKTLPGLQGIGFTLKIPADRLAAHTAEIRREGFPDYHVWPEGGRETYTSIIYLEPFSGRNLRAFGYDMYNEPIRRDAMDRARDSDMAALTSKVQLVQENGQDVQAGMLMMVPVYRGQALMQTLSERRAMLIGWAYSPFRMNDFMQGILGKQELRADRPLGLTVYDGERISADTLLYDGSLRRRGPSIVFRQTSIDFNGHAWTLVFDRETEPPLLSAHYARVL